MTDRTSAVRPFGLVAPLKLVGGKTKFIEQVRSFMRLAVGLFEIARLLRVFRSGCPLHRKREITTSCDRTNTVVGFPQDSR
jgi:hypothetical protein